MKLSCTTFAVALDSFRSGSSRPKQGSWALPTSSVALLAARCSEHYSHARLLQLIQAAPPPVGFRYGFRRLETVSVSRTVPPDTFTDDERREYEAAQSALLKSVGRDAGEPAPGVVGVARNVLEQFILRWF